MPVLSVSFMLFLPLKLGCYCIFHITLLHSSLFSSWWSDPRAHILSQCSLQATMLLVPGLLFCLFVFWGEGWDLPDTNKAGKWDSRISLPGKPAPATWAGTWLRIRKHFSFFKQVAAYHTQSPNIILPRMGGRSPKDFSEVQCPEAAPGALGQQGTAGNGSGTDPRAGSSYKRPWWVQPSSFSLELRVLGGEDCTSSSSHCSKSTGQVWDVDCVGCPAALGACASSSFFAVSTGGKAGQSHFFLRVLQVICTGSRER